ncbi:hypothetical protein OGAPHI_005956 [Ogataea philodendri]|uniref:B-block binding subunit of TFIIIC domain-containing protein n=1 Tax=Ogataea philodendri TaxID=1378263 RepID=A0A9P8NWW9_9ASCO|nr:uncharacterized protein OGAPHI_005956 [Ogataea philodendri]KAH3661778.1 hypothetical protein OGAPHI_005956 [Ogataea philodendri]
MSVTSPDEVVSHISDILCVEENGLSVGEVWESIGSKFARFGAFEKTLVWSWLTSEEDFIVFTIESTKTDKNGKKTYDRQIIDDSSSLLELIDQYGEANLRVGVSEDKQSLFLLGVTKENNTLGYFPYELLRYITKSKQKGISSTELIQQSGQDRRSLTSRLQTLEDLGLVKKFPAIIDSANSYIIVSTKYEDQFLFTNVKTAFDLMGVIMKSLEEAPNGVRVPSDLAREQKLTAKRERRTFSKAVRNLVILGYATKINVQHESSGRKFIGLQLVKEFPKSAAEKQQLKAQLADIGQDRDDEQDELFNSVFESSEDESPTFNPFFPLQNQIYDTVKNNPGISTKKLNTSITGALSVKSFSNYLTAYVLESPGSEQNTIIRYLQYDGKARYYSHMTQNDFLRQQGTDIPEQEAGFLPVLPNTQSIVELSTRLYVEPFSKRVSLILLPNQSFKFYWFGYSGPLLKSLVNKPGLIKKLVVDDSFSILVSKKIELSGEPKTILGGNFDEFTGDIHKRSGPSSVLTKTETEVKIEEATHPAEIDFGPGKRRSALVQIVNAEKCVILNMDLMKKISDKLNVSYLVDRRTVKKDATILEKENLIEVRQVESSVRSATHIVLCSTSTPPTENDIDQLSHSVSRPSTRVNPLLITAPTQPVFKANDSHFFQMPPQLVSTLRSSDGKRGLNTSKHAENRLKAAGRSGESKKKRSFAPKEEDLLGPLMESRKRKKVSSRTKSQQTTSKSTKRARNNTRLSSRDVLLLIRAIIISQSLSSANNIDWSRVSALFDDKYTAEILRRQWPRHKRVIGMRALHLSRKTWERILMSAVSSGEITEKQLVDYDLAEMIQLWRSMDAESFENTHDIVLYRDYDENFKEQQFRPDISLRGADVFKEGTSIIEREEQYARISFTYPAAKPQPELQAPTRVQEAKVMLKALFATGPEKFSSAKAKKVFSSTEKEVYSKALSELEDDKVIAYLGEDSPIKFTLTEKIMFLIDWKFTRSFFDQCSGFVEMMESATLNNKGVILSPQSPDSCFAPLINLMAENHIKVTRIDQKPPVLVDNYSTKSQDKTKLESDFILHNMKNFVDLKTVPPPGGAPCSHLWIDLNGDFNMEIWLKTVCSLIRCIVFRPGVTFERLCLRFSPLYEPFELKPILDWLIAKNSIHEKKNGYWANSNWYLTFDRYTVATICFHSVLFWSNVELKNVHWKTNSSTRVWNVDNTSNVALNRGGRQQQVDLVVVVSVSSEILDDSQTGLSVGHGGVQAQLFAGFVNREPFKGEVSAWTVVVLDRTGKIHWTLEVELEHSLFDD